MNLLHSPMGRRLFLLALLLSALFLMHPQQTAYAATCCSVCDANLANCEAGCEPSLPNTCKICERIYARCEASCNPGC
jgi:hypothetical protein